MRTFGSRRHSGSGRAATPQQRGFTSSDATSHLPGGYDPNFVHCPSETTSTEPSSTLMAVCSSMAQAGTRQPPPAVADR
jgi:hypothetical protein